MQIEDAYDSENVHDFTHEEHLEENVFEGSMDENSNVEYEQDLTHEEHLDEPLFEQDIEERLADEESIHNVTMGDDSEELDNNLSSDFSEDDNVFLDSSNGFDTLVNDPRDVVVYNLSEFCLTHLADNTTNKLLRIIRPLSENLPRNHQELYGTPEANMPNPVAIDGGKMMYIGIENNLKFFEFEDFNCSELVAKISWDGVKIFKSRSIKMEPLVMSFENYKAAGVLLIGMYYGKEPRNPNEYFYSLIKELNSIYRNNRRVKVGSKNREIAFRTSTFIADTPARTFALGEFTLKNGYGVFGSDFGFPIFHDFPEKLGS